MVELWEYNRGWCSRRPGPLPERLILRAIDLLPHTCLDALRYIIHDPHEEIVDSPTSSHWVQKVEKFVLIRCDVGLDRDDVAFSLGFVLSECISYPSC